MRITVKPVSQYLIVFIFSFAFFAYYQFQSQWLPDTDGYYHIKTAWLLRTQGFMPNFKWAHLSLWSDHYSDKEFFYHIYLIPFTFINDLVLAGKLATMVIASFVFLSFYTILRLNRIRYAWFWLLLLSMTGGFFLYRVNVPRPQGLSIIFVLWSIHFLLNRKLLPLAVLCFLYTYSYTAYHLPFIFACIIYFEALVLEKENDWKRPVTVFIAIIAGMLLSPFFPDNIRMFYLQNFYILWKGSGNGVNLHMGGEFGVMDTLDIIMVNTTLVIAFLGAFFLAIYQPLKQDKKVRQLFLIAVSLIFLNCFSKRFAEYSVPVTMLFCAFFFNTWLTNFSLKQLSKYKKMILFPVAIIVIAGLGYQSFLNTIDQFRGVQEPGLRRAALWLRDHTAENELVYTADWDDAPELFFFNHKDRYLVFLDPNFMYYWNPDLWHRWDDVSNGREGMQTYNILKKEFKVQYAVATNDFAQLREIVEKDKRMKIVFESAGGYVFEIKSDTPSHINLKEQNLWGIDVKKFVGKPVKKLLDTLPKKYLSYQFVDEPPGHANGVRFEFNDTISIYINVNDFRFQPQFSKNANWSLPRFLKENTYEIQLFNKSRLIETWK
jgi:hypothetical protein